MPVNGLRKEPLEIMKKLAKRVIRFAVLCGLAPMAPMIKPSDATNPGMTR